MVAELKQESKEFSFRAMTDTTCPCIILINALKKYSCGYYSPNDTL